MALGPSGCQDEDVEAESEAQGLYVRNVTSPCLDTFCRLDWSATRFVDDAEIVRLSASRLAACQG